MDAGYEMTLVDVSPEDESSQRSGGSTLAGNGSTARRGGGRNSRERSVERESEKIGLLGFGGGGGFGGGPSSEGNFPQNSLTPQQQSWAVVIKLVLLLVVAILVGATLGAVSRLASSLSGSAAGPGSTLGAFEVAGDEKSWLRIYLSKSSPQRVLFRIPQSSLGKLFIRSDLTEHGSGHGGGCDRLLRAIGHRSSRMMLLKAVAASPCAFSLSLKQNLPTRFPTLQDLVSRQT